MNCITQNAAQSFVRCTPALIYSVMFIIQLELATNKKREKTKKKKKKRLHEITQIILNMFIALIVWIFELNTI